MRRMELLATEPEGKSTELLALMLHEDVDRFFPAAVAIASRYPLKANGCLILKQDGFVTPPHFGSRVIHPASAEYECAHDLQRFDALLAESRSIEHAG